MTKISKIQAAEVTNLLPLFHDYLKFYRVEPKTTNESFLKDRIQNNDSVVFVAKDGEKIVGFAQLYFTYSSLMQGKVVILNDLYILPEFRRKNLAGMLIDKTLEYAKEKNLQVIVYCPFVATYLKRHPEYNFLVKNPG